MPERQRGGFIGKTSTQCQRAKAEADLETRIRGILVGELARLAELHAEDARAERADLRRKLTAAGARPAPLGDPVFHLALCVGCAPVLPQPLADREDREKWVERHRAGTGHRVMLADEYSGGWLRVTYWGGR